GPPWLSSRQLPSVGFPDAVTREKLLAGVAHALPATDEALRRRQSLEDERAIPLRDDAPIQENYGADVRFAADQPAESLFQLERCVRNEVMAEAVQSLRLEALEPRRGEGLARHLEGQLREDQHPQRAARHVHALPKGIGAEQDRGARVAEAAQQQVAPALALPQEPPAAAALVRITVSTRSNRCSWGGGARSSGTAAAETLGIFWPRRSSQRTAAAAPGAGRSAAVSPVAGASSRRTTPRSSPTSCARRSLGSSSDRRSATVSTPSLRRPNATSRLSSEPPRPPAQMTSPANSSPRRSTLRAPCSRSSRPPRCANTSSAARRAAFKASRRPCPIA